MPFLSDSSGISTIDGHLSTVAYGRGRGQVGRYRLAGRIATGGMADVYLAVAGELSGFRTLVVVKRVLPHLAVDRDFIRMFLDEARLATLLDHPNIARVIEIGKDGGVHFLAIEAVRGLALSAILSRAVKSRSAFSQAELAFIVAQAAQGLGYAHRLNDAGGRPLNVVHRDVSPQNLMVSFEGAVKVIDFGVARALGRVSRTRPGHLKGKLAYMSPEQVATAKVDRRSDLFSLGVVLWELLCGERLFARESDAETKRAIVDRPIPAPSRIVAIPRALESIVMHALQKDPAQRFDSAESFALELDRFAYATDEFDPGQIGRVMRALFAPEYQTWKRRVSAALALDPLPEGWWPDSSGTSTSVRPADSAVRVRTVALRRPTPRAVQAPPVYPKPVVRPGRDLVVRSPPKARTTNNDEARGGVTAMIGAVVLVCIGVGVIAARWREWTVVAAEQDAAVVVLPLPSPSRDAIVIARAQPEPMTLVPITESRAAATSTPSEQPEANSSDGTEVPRPLAIAPSHPATVRHRRPKITPSSSKRLRQQREAQGPCAILLGTQPWSEVWIDGKRTNQNTPYWEAIECGLHQVTFKRQDLGLAKTIAVTASPGEIVRRTLQLAR